MLEIPFKCNLKEGIHLRPATFLREKFLNLNLKARLHNKRTGIVADLDSVFSLLEAQVLFGDEYFIKIESNSNKDISFDAKKSLALKIRKIVEVELTNFEEKEIEESKKKVSNFQLPLLLSSSNSTTPLYGTPIQPGIVKGSVYKIGNRSFPKINGPDPFTGIENEVDFLNKALSSLRSKLGNELQINNSSLETELLKSHLSILNDFAIWSSIDSKIKKEKISAKRAVLIKRDEVKKMFSGLKSPKLREREADFDDLFYEILGQLSILSDNLEVIQKVGFPQEEIQLQSPSILVAKNIGPYQLMSLERNNLIGLIFGDENSLSHTAILARGLGLPTICGVENIENIENESEIILDATRGLIWCQISEEIEDFYFLDSTKEKKFLEKINSESELMKREMPFELGINIGNVEEIENLSLENISGVGLFRTEGMLFNRDTMPDESEQYQIYKKLSEVLNGRTAIIRTFDIGGDKEIPFLNLPKEENPFLGERGVRFYKKNKSILLDQFKAILRANFKYKNLKIMIPMISNFEEVKWCKEVLEEASESLNLNYPELSFVMPQFGIMVEVPSVLYDLDEIKDKVDFFSIGSNDLLQYFFAAERGNPSLKSFQRTLDWELPLRIMEDTIKKLRNCNKWVGVCGQMASIPGHLNFFRDMGVNEISVPVGAINNIKAGILSQISLEKRKGKKIFSKENFILADKYLLQSNATYKTDLNKDKVIKILADYQYILGNTDCPDLLESEIRSREESYSTGIGFGIALPHVKSKNLNSSTLFVLKLSQGIDYKSFDKKPVSLIIFLAVKENEAHEIMALMIKVSKMLAKEEFRNRLLSSENYLQIKRVFEHFCLLD